MGYNTKDQFSQVISYTDRIYSELAKNMEFMNLGEDRFNLKSCTSIKKISSVFQELYQSNLKFSQFDERLFNYNLKGDISPIKRYPYKFDSTMYNMKENKVNTAYRALDFSKYKNEVNNEIKLEEQGHQNIFVL